MPLGKIIARKLIQEGGELPEQALSKLGRLFDESPPIEEVQQMILSGASPPQEGTYLHSLATSKGIEDQGELAAILSNLRKGEGLSNVIEKPTASPKSKVVDVDDFEAQQDAFLDEGSVSETAGEGAVFTDEGQVMDIPGGAATNPQPTSKLDQTISKATTPGQKGFVNKAPDITNPNDVAIPHQDFIERLNLVRKQAEANAVEGDFRLMQMLQDYPNLTEPEKVDWRRQVEEAMPYFGEGPKSDPMRMNAGQRRTMEQQPEFEGQGSLPIESRPPQDIAAMADRLRASGKSEEEVNQVFESLLTPASPRKGLHPNRIDNIDEDFWAYSDSPTSTVNAVNREIDYKLSQDLKNPQIRQKIMPPERKAKIDKWYYQKYQETGDEWNKIMQIASQSPKYLNEHLPKSNKMNLKLQEAIATGHVDENLAQEARRAWFHNRYHRPYLREGYSQIYPNRYGFDKTAKNIEGKDIIGLGGKPTGNVHGLAKASDTYAGKTLEDSPDLAKVAGNYMDKDSLQNLEIPRGEVAPEGSDYFTPPANDQKNFITPEDARDPRQRDVSSESKALYQQGSEGRVSEPVDNIARLKENTADIPPSEFVGMLNAVKPEDLNSVDKRAIWKQTTPEQRKAWHKTQKGRSAALKQTVAEQRRKKIKEKTRKINEK